MDWLTPVLFVAGFFLLVAGAESLVRGAARLAQAAGVSALVVGLTVVAYGTSAPELAVTVQSAVADPPQPGIAVGNVVGSNISNVLLVLGIAAAIAPLIVSRHVVRLGVPLMIGVSLLMAVFAWDGRIARWEGATLFLGSLLYTTVTVVYSRRETKARRAADPALYANRERATLGGVIRDLALVLVGLGGLTLGARWLVAGAVAFAQWMGVSELIVGLTIVAVGTSLPEIATTTVAVYRGQRDIAVGNVVGSNLFNILLVLGVCGLLAPGGVVVPSDAVRFDIPVMVAAALVCLPVCCTGHQITRWEGILFLVSYAAYVAYLCLAATEHPGLPVLRRLTLYGVVPLIAVASLVYWYRLCARERSLQGPATGKLEETGSKDST